MPRTSGQKLKILYLYRILSEQTDEDHPMTIREMIGRLSEFGIRAVFAESPQTSLDPVETRAWIPNATYGCWAFGYNSFDKWIEHRAESLPWIEKFSPAGLLRACTAAKAPTFLYACAASLKPGELAKDPTHSSAFCDRFREIAEQKGVTCRRDTAEAFVQVLVRGR